MATTAKRTLRFDHATLTLVQGREETDYRLSYDPDGVVLVKADVSEVYHVNLKARRCDCKGHHYRGHCKHYDAVAKLAQMGLLIN